MAVSETFLLGLLATTIKNGIVTAHPGYKLLGSSISRLGIVYAYKVEAEHKRLAYLRVKARDDQELRERGVLKQLVSRSLTACFYEIWS